MGKIKFGLHASAAALAQPLFSEWAKKQWVEAFASLPGLPAKGAQILAQALGVSPNLARPKGLDSQEFLALLKQRSPKWAASVCWIAEEGVAASLGQVNQVRVTHDPTVYAVKLLYPGVKESLLSQVDAAVTLLGRSPAAKFEIDLEQYRTILTQSLELEVDYNHELKNQARFRSLYAPWIQIARTFPDHSTSDCLVQEWLGSRPIEWLRQQPSPLKRRFAESLCTWQMLSLFKTGLVHTDLHVDNLGVIENTGEVAVYDFGSVLQFPPEFVLALRTLVSGPDDLELTQSAFTNLGFSATSLQKMGDRILPLTEALIYPFRTNEVDWTQWHLSQQIEALLGKDKWWFRSGGHPHFLLLMRSLSAVFEQLRLLEVPVSFRSLAQTHLPDLTLRPLSERQILPDSKPPAAASQLCVEVTEQGHQVVRVQVGAKSVEWLEDLIPPEVLESFAAQNIDIEAIKRKAISSGLTPQNLFTAQKGLRSYRVWLE